MMPTPPEAAAIWKRARDAGKITKCHAGEFDGAARVREAIEVLGVKRIQHGVRAIEDPAVVKLAAESGVTFDVCPISNVGLKVVPSMKDHPIRRLMHAGIRCTVSTDDPLCFANSLTEEYETLATELTFSATELAQVASNGWEVADVPASTRKSMLAEIEKIVATAG
jgi:adenosine deaminase